MGRRDFGGGWVLLKSLRIFGEHFAKFRKCCPARVNGLLCLLFRDVRENCYDFLRLAKLREKSEDVNPHFHLFSNLELSISAKYYILRSPEVRAYWIK